MEFNERLKSLRVESAQTQSVLAKHLNYGYTAISNYESGKNEPSISDLKKIASFYNVSLDYLLCVNDIRNPYIKSEYPEDFDSFVNMYSELNDESHIELKFFMEWLIERQTRAESRNSKIYKAAQETAVYKTKDPTDEENLEME